MQEKRWIPSSSKTSKHPQKWKAMNPVLTRNLRHLDENSSWNFCPQAAWLSFDYGCLAHDIKTDEDRAPSKRSCFSKNFQEVSRASLPSVNLLLDLL